MLVPALAFLTIIVSGIAWPVDLQYDRPMIGNGTYDLIPMLPAILVCIWHFRRSKCVIMIRGGNRENESSLTIEGYRACDARLLLSSLRHGYQSVMEGGQIVANEGIVILETADQS